MSNEQINKKVIIDLINLYVKQDKLNNSIRKNIDNGNETPSQESITTFIKLNKKLNKVNKLIDKLNNQLGLHKGNIIDSESFDSSDIFDVQFSILNKNLNKVITPDMMKCQLKNSKFIDSTIVYYQKDNSKLIISSSDSCNHFANKSIINLHYDNNDLWRIITNESNNPEVRDALIESICESYYNRNNIEYTKNTKLTPKNAYEKYLEIIKYTSLPTASVGETAYQICENWAIHTDSMGTMIYGPENN